MEGSPIEVPAVNGETIIVGPDEVLIVRVPANAESPTDRPLGHEIAEALNAIGLTGRCLVIGADGVEFAKAIREPDAS